MTGIAVDPLGEMVPYDYLSPCAKSCASEGLSMYAPLIPCSTNTSTLLKQEEESCGYRRFGAAPVDLWWTLEKIL